MQRNIDRLVNSTTEPEGKIIDEFGKIKFDRLKFDLDKYSSILEKFENFDMKKIKAKNDKVKSTVMQDISKPTSAIQYNDNLSISQLGHMESIFSKTCKKCDTIKAP